jgi:hypothetical protein
MRCNACPQTQHNHLRTMHAFQIIMWFDERLHTFRKIFASAEGASLCTVLRQCMSSRLASAIHTPRMFSVRNELLAPLPCCLPLVEDAICTYAVLGISGLEGHMQPSTLATTCMASGLVVASGATLDVLSLGRLASRFFQSNARTTTL